MAKRIKNSFATKFTLVFAALFFVTMLAIVYGVRQIIAGQLTKRYEREVESAVRSIRTELQARHESISRQLWQLGRQMTDDNNFRLQALVLQDVYDPFLIDYAGKYMPAMGLQTFEIADQTGIVLSSGHARNTFGKQIGSRIQQLQSLKSQCGLVWFDEPDKQILCLTALESVRLGERRFHLIGGMEITPAFLTDLLDDSTDCVLLQLPTSAISSSPEKQKEILENISSGENNEASFREFEKKYAVSYFDLPLVTGNSAGTATVYLLRPKTDLIHLLDNVNRRIFIISGIGMFLAIGLSIWLTSSVAKPLERLAVTAGTLSPDKLDVEFNVKANDEVGVLSDALANLLKRLRLSRMKLAAAERKAAVAEIARHVNHDIKNGFIPIRNVMQHWQEAAEQDIAVLAKAFNERKSTVLESLDYLEHLARHYLRFRPPAKLTAININHVIQNLLQNYRDLENGELRIQADLAPGEPVVQADEIQLRRAFENVLQNSLEAVNGTGTICVTTVIDDSHVTISWKDTGAGIPEEIRDQLFKSYITTKEEGTGLGLVNVKRITEDFGGTVAIESEIGTGTTVRMVLPKASEESQVREN